MSDVLAAQEAVARWRDDPVLFVEQVFGAEPDEWQADALRAISKNPRVGMSACKGPGKSCVLAWAAWWFLATRVGAQIMCVSITEDNCKDNLWKEIAYWQAQSEWLLAAFSVRSERVVSNEPRHERTWWISLRAFAQNADPNQQANTLAGFHGRNIMIILDEMGDFPEGVVSAAEAIFANEDQDEAKLVAAWNPTRTDGPAYRICTRSRHIWVIINITGDPDDPKRSPRISRRWAEEQIQQWGRDNAWVRVNVLGLFPLQGDDVLISLEAVKEAEERDVSPMEYRDEPMIWGLDPSRFGSDASALCRRQGKVCFRFKQWRGLDGPQLANRIAALLDETDGTTWFPDALFVDVGGVGSSCFDWLVRLKWGTVVHPVDFASSPDDGRYLNKRAEIWFRMADWVNKRKPCLPLEPKLPGELVAPKFDYRPVQKQTKFCIEAKKDMKKRGIESPNLADALALTFSADVFPRAKSPSHLMSGQGRATCEYNPLLGGDQGSGGGLVHHIYDPLGGR